MTDADNQGEMREEKKQKPSRVAALVLKDGVSTPTVFPGVVPGVFTPGVPRALSHLGLTEREAKLLIEGGAPLTLTRVSEQEV